MAKTNSEKYICPKDGTEMEVTEKVMQDGQEIGVALYCEQCLLERRPKSYYKLHAEKEIKQGIITPIND